MARRARRRKSDDEAAAFGILLAIYASYRLQENGLLIWAATGLLLFLSLVFILKRGNRQKARLALVQSDIAGLSHVQFEKRIEALLNDMGWIGVERVGGRGDRGVDLRGKYQDQTYVVQCKHKAKVTPAEMRDFVGTRVNQKVHHGLFITSGRYTRQARQESQGNPIELWDGDDLAEHIAEIEAEKQTPEAKQEEKQAAHRFYSRIILVNILAIVWVLIVTAMSL